MNYISKIDQFNIDPIDDPSNISTLVQSAKNQVKNFGSPKILREHIVADPNFLSNDGDIPKDIYSSIVRLVNELSQFSGTLIASLQFMNNKSNLPDDARNEMAKEIASQADKANSKAHSFNDSAIVFKKEMVQINERLKNAYEKEAKVLQGINEKIGGLKYQIPEIEKKIDDLGYFSSRKTKENLKSELESAQQELTEFDNKGKVLTDVMKQIEPIINEANWIDLGIKNILDFETTLSDTLKSFGSSAINLSVVAQDGETIDPKPTWIDTAIGAEDIINEWGDVKNAARSFSSNALIDYEE
ncbi:MAG: hypothetical protein ACJATI_004012 [Halioglobus sp.]|jgi:hypothetical protein